MSALVFLSHTGADSGAEQSTVATLAHWPADRPRPDFLVGAPGAIQERAARAGVQCQLVDLGSRSVELRRTERHFVRTLAAVVGLVRRGVRLRQVLVAQEADVVVAISLKALLSAGMWRLAGRGRTLVWSLHDRVAADYFPRWIVPLLRYVVPRLVDGVIVNSEATLATVRPGRTPVLLSPPATELDPRAFSPPAPEVRRVVMLGRLSPWKGQDVFLDAFATAFAGTEAEAHVVGGALFGEDDYVQRLHDQARRLGIDGQVDFLGHVADPWAHLVQADVLVHASRIPEPFGLVVVQGLWARCAVVATRPGGPAEIITDGVDGLLVRGGDASALTEALVQLRDDPGLRSRLADQGRRTAVRFGAAATSPPLAAWIDAVKERRVCSWSVTRSVARSSVPDSS